MLRAALLCTAIFAAAWLEFTVFPGHSYLEGDSQLYVPMIERVDTPGLLARDLVATSPALALTAYDEATLLLHNAGKQSYEKALLWQQAAFRVAALAGLFLLARAAGLNRLLALTASAIVNLGATVAGPALSVTEREPLPGPFAFALTILAMGLLADGKPLLAGLAGGVAFLYDPILAGPFWCVLLAAFCFDKKLRTPLRPTMPILIVFILLLANLAQLQPGTPAEPIFARLPLKLEVFQRTYAPHLYVTSWPKGEIYQILALCVLAFWAAARSWSMLSRCLRWLLLGTASCGVLAVPVSYILTERAHLAWAAQLQPARTLLFTASAAGILFGLAGMRAILRRFTWEALGWFFALFALPAGEGVFDFLRVFNNWAGFSRFAIALALAALLTSLLLAFAANSARFVTLAVPAVACWALAGLPGLRPNPIPLRASIGEMAEWAGGSTWGSSVFLFADAERARWPGIFRAESRHALWADWHSARGVAFSQIAASAWEERWKQTMERGFSKTRLETLLPLPIDYYVLRRRNRLAGVKSAFANGDFVVYDAQDLRTAPKPLR